VGTERINGSSGHILKSVKNGFAGVEKLEEAGELEKEMELEEKKEEMGDDYGIREPSLPEEAVDTTPLRYLHEKNLS
jgi:hypothetical protein